MIKTFAVVAGFTVASGLLTMTAHAYDATDKTHDRNGMGIDGAVVERFAQANSGDPIIEDDDIKKTDVIVEDTSMENKEVIIEDTMIDRVEAGDIPSIITSDIIIEYKNMK